MLIGQERQAASGFSAPVTETNVGFAFDEKTPDNAYACGFVFHTGRDMNAAACCGNDPNTGDRDKGTPVLAAADGVVAYADVLLRTGWTARWV